MLKPKSCKDGNRNEGKGLYRAVPTVSGRVVLVKLELAAKNYKPKKSNS